MQDSNGRETTDDQECWRDNINKELLRLGVNMRGAVDLTNECKTFQCTSITIQWLALGTDDDGKE